MAMKNKTRELLDSLRRMLNVIDEGKNPDAIKLRQLAIMARAAIADADAAGKQNLIDANYYHRITSALG